MEKTCHMEKHNSQFTLAMNNAKVQNKLKKRTESFFVDYSVIVKRMATHHGFIHSLNCITKQTELAESTA